MHARSPKAKVLAIGYPQLVSADHVCSKLPLATGDYAYLEKINRALTEAVRQAAKESGATYVDVWKASQGHDICSADPWINGSVNQQGKALRYHPFAAEQVAVASLVESSSPTPDPSTVDLPALVREIARHLGHGDILREQLSSLLRVLSPSPAAP